MITRLEYYIALDKRSNIFSETNCTTWTPNFTAASQREGVGRLRVEVDVVDGVRLIIVPDPNIEKYILSTGSSSFSLFQA